MHSNGGFCGHDALLRVNRVSHHRLRVALCCVGVAAHRRRELVDIAKLAMHASEIEDCFRMHNAVMDFRRCGMQ